MFSIIILQAAKIKQKEKKQQQNSNANMKELNPWPDYIQNRLVLWEKLKAKYDEELARKPEKAIVVTLPDGKKVEATSWKTTPYEVAKGIRWQGNKT